jgi:hypothetical protein
MASLRCFYILYDIVQQVTVFFICVYKGKCKFMGITTATENLKPLLKDCWNSSTVDSPNTGSFKNITPALKREYCILLSRAWVTTDGFGLAIQFIGHFNTQLATTHYKSLSHTDLRSQSRSPLCFLVVANNSGCSLPLSSQAVPSLSYKLLTSLHCNSQLSACLQTLFRLTGNGSWS